ncbi:MAG: family 20 glycosylhydrolase [Bacteroidetes bacterium]|nr:family 20 glycosylhydrolase [Bacteroidota bacterium]
MKNIIFLLLILTITTVNGQNSSIKLIPQPVELNQLKGVYILKSTTSIGFNKAESKKVAEMLVQSLNIPTGFNLKALQGKSGAIQLNINEKPNLQLGKEGYVIESSSKGVVISANEPAGLYYGTQTMLQLLPKEIESKETIKGNWTIPAAKIIDYPRFAWRGLMLDVSRHFFNKDEVKQYIAQMAKFKFNTFHWHLTDDNGWRIEIKSLPRLTQVGAWRVPREGQFGIRPTPKPGEPATDGGFYTQEDIKEIIQFAQDRYVTILPEIDVPGHSMAAVAAYPELSCTKDTSVKVNPGSAFSDWYGNGTFKLFVDNTLNPSNEKVYEFLDKVFTEVAALFPNPYIHVGGDECYKGYWSENADCKALMKKLNIRHIEDLQGYFMNRLEGILKAKGKKLIGWDEILEGGISPEATVMSWRGIAGGIEAAKMGHDVVMTPTTFAYLDYCQGDPTVDPPIYANLRVNKCYSYEPVPDGVDAKYILGGQGNLWTENVPTLRHVDYMTYPRSWALSEVLWSQKEKKDWNNFVPRLENQFKRADLADINYSRSIYDADVKTFLKGEKMTLDISTEISDLTIYYTYDGTMPDSHSLKYTNPIVIPEGPITIRVITYRNGTPIGHLITLKPEELKRRAVKI